MEPLNELYREVILDHYQEPRHRGTLTAPTLVVDGKNPLCGDELTLHLQIVDDRIVDLAWEGHGCSISMASASMLAAELHGKTLAEATTYLQAFHGLMRGTPVDRIALGDLEVLEGVRKFPVRIKCALLPWTTLQEGMKQYDGHPHHIAYTERE